MYSQRHAQPQIPAPPGPPDSLADLILHLGSYHNHDVAILSSKGRFEQNIQLQLAYYWMLMGSIRQDEVTVVKTANVSGCAQA